LPTLFCFSICTPTISAGYTKICWIFSHGNTYFTRGGDEITYFVSMDDDITNQDLTNELKPEGCSELPIRMVYSIGCYHSNMNDAWLDLGTQVVSGATLINFFPTQYGKFVSEWNNGKTYSTSLTNSNTAASRTIVYAYLTVLSFTYSNQGKCSFIPNVLGKTNCAEWFFTGGGPYDLGDNYNSSISGKANVNQSSKKIISGDGSIKKNTILEWEM